jgi:predicted MFS family arabinose efflux permease
MMQASQAEGPSAARRSPSAPGTERSMRQAQWVTWSGTPPILRDERKFSWHALKHRRFLFYFVGSLVSNLGTWLQNTAQMLLAYELTHSPFAVGMITCAQFSGFLLLGPWAGGLADRLGNRRVLIGTQFLSASVAGALAYLQFSGTLTERSLLIAALGIGLAFTFALPVQTAMVPQLVPQTDTKAAMALNSVSYNAGRTLAPVLCVVVLTSIGVAWAFALNAMSFVIFAATVVAVHPRCSSRSARRPHDWAALRLAVWQPRILLLLAMVASVTVADDPVLVLGPTLAHQVLAVSSVWPAYFLSGLGLGSVLGAFVPTKPSTVRRAAVPLLALALSVIVFTSGFAAWVSLCAALAAGVAALLTGGATQALLLSEAGPRQATKVMALWAVAWAGSKPLASVTDGWLASDLGVRWAGLLLAAPALAVAVLELWLPANLKERAKQFVYAHKMR